MPLIHVSDPGVVVLNIAFWLTSFLVAGWTAARTPLGSLRHDGPVLRLRRFESGGRWYERHLHIQRWKDRLPEAGTALGGELDKRHLPSRHQGGLERFAAETRRAERAHWSSLIGLPLTAIWNPPVGVLAMVVFGVVFNAPFIAIQRYNRARIDRVVGRRRATRRAFSGG